MKSIWPVSLALVAAALTMPALGADITFYEHDGFRGRSFTANQSISNFSNVGYNDRASSVVVHDGTWQLCSDAYFRGHCVTLSRGQYPSLAAMGLNDAVSSARDMGWLGSGPGGGGGLSGGAPPARVELFDGVDFQFQSFAVAGTIRNFADVAYNDHAASMIVYEGTWEACTDADFRGMCRTYGPGRYPDLAELKQRISSMRPVAGGGGSVGGGGGGGLGGGGGGGWGSGARAILYERPNLSGRSFVIDSEVAANLATMGFNDRASSIRIERGYWIFCTDANFGGECQTFGPGDYPSLPWGMDRKISSGRRIHGQYPYNQPPNWQR